MNKFLRHIQYIGLMLSLFLLSGCWNSLDIKNAAIVTGTGFDKSQKGYRISVQVLKPEQNSGSQNSGNVVLQRDSKTLHGFARDFIRDSKRRLIFTHNKVWIVKDSLAKENLLRLLDDIERDEMPRLNSFLLVTSDDPEKVLKTPPLFKSMSSIELPLGMRSVTFISDYPTDDIRQMLRMLSEPPYTAYVPIIHIRESAGTPVLELDGAGIIHGQRMIGKLNLNETMGLLWLRNKVKGSSLTADGLSKYPAQVEVQGLGTSYKLDLRDNHLTIHVLTRVRGGIAEVPPDIQVNKKFISRLANNISNTVEDQIRDTLKTLQGKYRTDITGIGLKVYRKYPKEWHEIESNWNNIFAHAKVIIDVKTEIYHPGLIYNTWHKKKNPNINPFTPGSWDKLH